MQSNANAAYWAKVQRRNSDRYMAEPPEETRYTCLCCYDTGSLTPGNYLRYGKLFASIPQDYDPSLDAPILCKYCRGIEITIDVPEGVKITFKFPLDAIYTSLSVSDCQTIHQQEIKRLQAESKVEKKLTSKAALQTQHQITDLLASKSMSSDSSPATAAKSTAG